jgi:CRP-like cAMP-binding protein
MSQPKPLEMIMDVTMQGFAQVKQAMEELQAEQQRLRDEQVRMAIQSRGVTVANYKAHTASGKARMASELVQVFGSQAGAAEYLGVTPGRISQLVNSEKNRKNGR